MNSHFLSEPIQASSLSRTQDLIALACRSHVQIHHVSAMQGISGSEVSSVQVSKQRNESNFTVTDVQWNHYNSASLATSSTNGAVVVFDFNAGAKSRIQLSNEVVGSRAVNRIAWAPFDSNLLGAANQDATVKIYDSRLSSDRSCIINIAPRSEACRDIQFSPHDSNYLGAVFESGNLIIWDKRRAETPWIKVTGAHTSTCLALSWCIAGSWVIATGGRDKNVKIWDFRNVDENNNCSVGGGGGGGGVGTGSGVTVDTANGISTSCGSSGAIRPALILHTPSGISRLKWRPPVTIGGYKMQLATTSVDRGDISVWDLSSPHLPVSIIQGHTDVCTGFSWLDTCRNDVESPEYRLLTRQSTKKKISDESAKEFLGTNQHIISVHKDGKVLVQDLRNGYFPRQHFSASLMSISSRGHVACQRNRIFRGDTLGVFVSTDRGNDEVDSLAKSLKNVPALFKEQKENYGMPLIDRVVTDDDLSSSMPLAALFSQNPSIAKNLLLPSNVSEGHEDKSSDNKTNQNIATISSSDLYKPKPILNSSFRSRLRSKHKMSHTTQLSGGKDERSSPTKIAKRRSTSSGDSSGSHLVMRDSSENNVTYSSPAGPVFIGLANIDNLSSAREICLGSKGGAAEGGAFDPAIVMFLARTYSMGRDGETHVHLDDDNDRNNDDVYINEHLLTSQRGILDGDCRNMEFMESTKAACKHNYNIAKTVGLQSHAAQWEALLILIPALIDDAAASNGTGDIKNGSADLLVGIGSVPSFPLNLAADLVGSQLLEFLEKGDCQHFVIWCEILRNSGLLDAATSTIPEIGSLRQREAYVMYIDLMTKLELFDSVGIILKYSKDQYISELNRKGSLLHITCAKCGKELPDGTESTQGHASYQGSWCIHCKTSVGMCTICNRVVSGMLVWCPICCHGGHSSCLKKWFSGGNKTCPSGCGHRCMITEDEACTPCYT